MLTQAKCDLCAFECKCQGLINCMITLFPNFLSQEREDMLICAQYITHSYDKIIMSRWNRRGNKVIDYFEDYYSRDVIDAPLVELVLSIMLSTPDKWDYQLLADHRIFINNDQ